MKKYLSQIYIYPVKSFKGMTLDSVEVGPKGPLMDRRWMVIDSEGRFLSQRKIPRMAMVHTFLDNRFLFLSAPKMLPLMLPTNPVGKPREVVVWKDTCLAHDMGEKAASWVSEFLDMPARLVYLPDDSVRKLNPKYATSDTDQLGFADAFPFLLISEASLEDLNKKVGKQLRMNRFRPNLVISNCAAYEEDTWKRIRIGSIIFEVIKPCTRCVTITVDQERAEKGSEPLDTLSRFRKSDGGVIFGQNLVHKSTGRLEKGTELEVLE